MRSQVYREVAQLRCQSHAAGFDQEGGDERYFASITRLGYPYFDRVRLNGLIQFSLSRRPEPVVGFSDTYRQLYPLSRDVPRGTADQFSAG